MEEGQVEDLATLAKLDEKVLLQELKTRYAADRIYTYVGDILVAVNPYRDLGIYTKQLSEKYRNVRKQASLPPHIFAVADAAYQAMQGLRGTTPRNQCILISGESGAGKTESTKFLIQQLMELCRGNSQLEQQILQVNPLLEAFGNAQTTMNDNSSRFGKYIQLRFYEGQVIGAKISEYLLEKSRLTQQNAGEQNFHMFYYLFVGLSAEQQARYKLGKPDQYSYLCDRASSLASAAPRLKRQYEELVNAMDMVGFSDQEQDCMYTILAGALTVGNIAIATGDTGESKIPDLTPLNSASELLGLDAGEMASVLTCNRTFTKGEEIRRNYTQVQAQDSRDAVAKAVYGRLFSWMVHKINSIMAPREVPDAEKIQEIGILDIFGFEHFQHNSFEQACINLANEQLQFFFNKHIFSLEQEEYQREGVDWQEIKFIDNQPLLDLYLGRPIGLLALLDEESLFPKGSDQSFVDKLNNRFGDHPNYFKSPHSKSQTFVIAHYAGKVNYDAMGWLEKNRDTLPPGVMEMLQQSTNPLLSLIFKGKISRTGTLALQGRSSKRSTRKQIQQSVMTNKERRLTVGAQFKNSLQVLMERMTSSQPVFIRCIKPNRQKTPNVFEEDHVQAQLLYTGMLETTKIRREGFAIRPAFEEFVKKFGLLVRHGNVAANSDGARAVLQASKLQGWHVGKTKVFLKYWQMEQLGEQLEALGRKAVHMQRVVRGFLGRRKVAKQRRLAQQEAARLAALMSEVNNLSLQVAALQNKVVLEDAKISPDFFKSGEKTQRGLPPVPEPSAPSEISYLPPTASQSQKPKSVSMADNMGEEGDILEDEFEPVKMSDNTLYGPVGTRMASTRWFAATQAHQVQTKDGTFAKWFHGIITRRDSEVLLMSKSVGSFLIRVSESRFGYSLSFKARDRCRHYMIDQTPGGKYVIIGEPKVHRSLADLVSWHQRYKLSNWDGLLTDPCGQVDGQCDYSDLVEELPYWELETSGLSIRPGSKAPPLPDRNYSYAHGIHGNQVPSTGLYPSLPSSTSTKMRMSGTRMTSAVRRK